MQALAQREEEDRRQYASEVRFFIGESARPLPVEPYLLDRWIEFRKCTSYAKIPTGSQETPGPLETCLLPLIDPQVPDYFGHYTVGNMDGSEYFPWLHHIDGFDELIRKNGPIVGAAVQNYYKNIGQVHQFIIHRWFGSLKLEYINHILHLATRAFRTVVIVEL